jgi:hypothetical protein
MRNVEIRIGNLPAGETIVLEKQILAELPITGGSYTFKIPYHFTPEYINHDEVRNSTRLYQTEG